VFIGINIHPGSAGSNSSSPIILAAPIVGITTAATDSTPDTNIDFDELTTLEGDVIRQQWVLGSDFTSPDVQTHIINATDLLNGAFDMTWATTRPDGLNSTRARMERGATTSDWSNTDSITIATDTNNLLLVAGGTDDLLLVDGSSKLLLAA